MLFAGGNQTAHYLQANSPELWARLHSFDLTVTRNELEEWWRTISDDYPDSEEDEHLLALYERALSFDDRDLALRYLEEWGAQEPDSDAKRGQLKYEYARLGDFESAAHIAASVLGDSENLWDKASALRDLVNLHRQAGKFSLSLSTAQKLDTTLAAFDDWIGVGLGRMAIHEVFELSFSHPDAADASLAFALADRWFQRSRNLALVGMEAGVKAARRCGLAQKAKEYEDIAAIERKRIDEMMS
jgi:tetratricopeptide (TPR) repeat protein